VEVIWSKSAKTMRGSAASAASTAATSASSLLASSPVLCGHGTRTRSSRAPARFAT
jgi:hypothetical protein